MKNLTATFVRKRFQDSGGEAQDFPIYEFTDIIGDDGKKYNSKWIKETKLMQAMIFQKGKKYIITLSRAYSGDYINMPFPIEIISDTERVYIKGRNSIIRVDKAKSDTNLSVPVNKVMGISNYDTAAINKFGKGLMTEELLKKMNSKGIFFHVSYCDPQDKRKSGGISYGFTKDKSKGNYILIKKETQTEIDMDFENIKQIYVPKSIEKYFKITTELIPKKRK